MLFAIILHQGYFHTELGLFFRQFAGCFRWGGGVPFLDNV